MPWIVGDKDKGFASYYQIPLGIGLINDCTDDLEIKRKEYATLLQQFKAYQKEFGQKKDLKLAKFFKREGRLIQKHYYGICAALDYSGSDKGDCIDRLNNVTQELAPYADFWITHAPDCKGDFKPTPEQKEQLDYEDMLKRFENAEQLKFLFMNIVLTSEQIDLKFEDEDY
jgi:hypothetical protein